MYVVPIVVIGFYLFRTEYSKMIENTMIDTFNFLKFVEYCLKEKKCEITQFNGVFTITVPISQTSDALFEYFKSKCLQYAFFYVKRGQYRYSLEHESVCENVLNGSAV